MANVSLRQGKVCAPSLSASSDMLIAGKATKARKNTGFLHCISDLAKPFQQLPAGRGRALAFW